MDLAQRYFGIHASALELRAQRLDLLASNIANAATPNYKARDLDFPAQLRAASGGTTLATDAPGQIGDPPPDPRTAPVSAFPSRPASMATRWNSRPNRRSSPRTRSAIKARSPSSTARSASSTPR